MTTKYKEDVRFVFRQFLWEETLEKQILHRKSDRAVKRREKILKAAFELICQKGHENTSMTDIAHAARVSMGTLYNYFQNKKAIFLDVYELYYNEIASQAFSTLGNFTSPFAFRNIIKTTIDTLVQYHYVNKSTHNEMMAMIHSDEEYRKKAGQCQIKTVDAYLPVLADMGFTAPYLRERMHFLLGIMDIYAHEVAYHETEGLEYEHIQETIIDFFINFVFR
jgi:AcrR family transcriptional regulator